MEPGHSLLTVRSHELFDLKKQKTKNNLFQPKAKLKTNRKYCLHEGYYPLLNISLFTLKFLILLNKYDKIQYQRKE